MHNSLKQAGFATIYNFYAWPVRTRPRLAQVLVVPPYQGMGIGKAMLRAAYGLAQERDATDLTVSVCPCTGP